MLKHTGTNTPLEKLVMGMGCQAVPGFEFSRADPTLADPITCQRNILT